MNGAVDPPRHVQPNRESEAVRPRVENTAPAPNHKGRNRHGAITDNLSKLQNYKQWAAKMRSGWDTSK